MDQSRVLEAKWLAYLVSDIVISNQSEISTEL